MHDHYCSMIDSFSHFHVVRNFLSSSLSNIDDRYAIVKYIRCTKLLGHNATLHRIYLLYKDTQVIYLPSVSILIVNDADSSVVIVNTMAPSTRRTKRRSSSPEYPDLVGTQQKKLKFWRSKGGATLSLIVTFPCLAKEHFTGPDAGATPSLTVTCPYSTKEHFTRAHSTEGPPAKARRGGPPRNKQIASLIVAFPPSAEEHIPEPDAGATPSFLISFASSAEEQPTSPQATESLPTKVPRSKAPRNKQRADQQNNSFSVDTRPKSWGMPEVWAEVFH